MATLVIQRIFPFGNGDKNNPVPFVGALPLANNAGNQSIVAGDVLTNSSGRALAANTATTGLVGLAEGTTTSATPAADTPMPATLIIPSFIYEGSHTGATFPVTDQLGNTDRDIADNAVGAVLNGAATAGTVTRIVTPLGYESQVSVNAFIGKSDTTATAGQTMTLNPAKGIVGDTNARVLFLWAPLACQLGI